MKQILLILAMISITFGITSCGEKEEELQPFSTQYNPKADPESDLNFAIATATEQNKRVLLLVGGDWCPWCRAFDGFLNETHPSVGEYLHDNFVLVKVYYGSENYNSKFMAGFPKLLATPHFYVLEGDGSLLLSQGSEEFEKGRSYDELKVMSFLQKWAKK